MHRLTQKDVCVRAVAYLPDGRLVSATGEKTVRVWEPLAGREVLQWRTNTLVFAVAVAPGGREVALAGREPPESRESVIHLRKLDDPQYQGELRWPIYRQPGGDRRVRSIWSLAYTGDGEYLIAARRVMGGGNVYDGGDCRWWQRSKPSVNGELTSRLRGYAVGSAASDTRFAVTAYSQLLVFDHPSQPAVATYPFTASWAMTVTFLPSGTAVVGMSSFLLFTDRLTKTGRLKPLKTDVRTIRTLAVSPDGRTLLVGGSPGRVEVYDIATRERRTAYDFDVGVVQSLAFAPDGLTFAVGAEKGLLVVDSE